MRKVSKWTALLLAGVLGASLMACGGGAASSEAAAPASSEAAAPASSEAAAPASSEAAAPASSEAAAPESSEAEAPAADDGLDWSQTYDWTFSTTYGTGTIAVNMYNRFAELANEYSNGAMTINVFPDGTITDEMDAIYQVSAGSLDFCGTGTGPIVAYSPESTWFTAPFMVTNEETYRAIYEESDYFAKEREKWATEYNCKDMGLCMFRGYRTLVCKYEIKSVDDLKGVKIRLNSDPLWNATWQAFGATTVPIALSELYTSIQNGVAEGCENTLAESGNLNIPEVVDYVIPTNHFCDCSVVLMTNSLYESLPAHYQDALNRALKDAIEEYKPKVAEDSAAALKLYTDAGCQVVEGVDIDSFKAAAADVWKEKFETDWTTISYDDAMALIAQYS